MIEPGTPIGDRLRAMLASRSAGDRMQMACAMFTTAKLLARAGILADAPGLDDAELRVRVFRRFYADVLQPEEIGRIEQRLRTVRRQ